MVEAPVLALFDVKGLKGAKASQLVAAMEIARRMAVPTERNKLQIKSTGAAAEYLRERLRGLSDEHFRVLYLNRRSALLDDALMAQGAVDSVRPPLRNIIARALQVNASALIAAHNHPSGAAEPSESDQLVTRDLIAACQPIGIRVLDHLIVTEQTHYSFADSGLLDELTLQVYDFPKLRELPWESWRFFALQLFQCRDEPHKIGGVQLDGYLKGESVLVFNHTKNPGARFTEETLEEIHEAVGSRVGSKFFIIAPALTFGFQQDYIDMDGVRYYALRIPIAHVLRGHARPRPTLRLRALRRCFPALAPLPTGLAPRCQLGRSLAGRLRAVR